MPWHPTAPGVQKTISHGDKQTIGDDVTVVQHTKAEDALVLPPGEPVGRSFSTVFFARHPVLQELVREQALLVFAVLFTALAASYLQYGSALPSGEYAFAGAGIPVTAWHLVWMGIWTGYAMALVGQASGTLSLAYSASVLQFNAVSLSPTTLLITFLNPLGALFGFRRTHQWNMDMAAWLCVGAILGAPLGPFIRVYLLSDPVPFKALIGVALLITAVQLCVEITPWYLRRAQRQRAFKHKFDHAQALAARAGRLGSGLPDDFRIVTVERTFRRVRIAYWGEETTLATSAMLAIGFAVGVAGSALGIGGGFLLVPILVIAYGLPMYVVVAASIPYVIVLSLVGLLSYLVTLPLLTGISIPPDWSFGLFVACGAIVGSWLAAKTQRFIPETYLKPLLGIVTGAIAALYLVNYFWRLPFQV